MKKISESIGHDGKFYFCLLCGRSGYSSMAQVKGHLAMCPGKAIQKGVVPNTQPVATKHRAGLQGLEQLYSQPVSQVVVTKRRAIPYYINYQQLHQQLDPVATSYDQQIDNRKQLDERVAKIENEYQHMLIAKNTSSGDWFSENKGLLILAVAVFLLFMFLRESQYNCDCETSQKALQKRGYSSTASALLARGAGKFVDMGIGKMFGK